jgi:hypothetical protein
LHDSINESYITDSALDIKLKAWFYRFDYVEKWTTAYKRKHGVIASQNEKNKDLEFTRNFLRMMQHSRDLKRIGCLEPLVAFKERCLHPQADMRTVSIPGQIKKIDFTVKKSDFQTLTKNFALEWSRSPAQTLHFHTPRNSRKLKK